MGYWTDIFLSLIKLWFFIWLILYVPIYLFNPDPNAIPLGSAFLLFVFVIPCILIITFKTMEIIMN